VDVVTNENNLVDFAKRPGRRASSLEKQSVCPQVIKHLRETDLIKNLEKESVCFPSQQAFERLI